nr:hypothetical protein [Tanacetum cinerariifolium]
MIFGFAICPVTREPTILKMNYPLYTDGPCLLFTIPHPAGRFLKLLGFSNDNEPIVEAEIVQQWYRSFSLGSSSTPSYSSEPSSPNSYSSGTTTPQNHHSGTSISGRCSNCKHLLGKIKVPEATVEMHMHLEQHACNLTALLHELYNDMDNLGL